MKTSLSTVQLFSLSVDRRGNIKMSATRHFFETLRSRLGSPSGASVRAGNFDFLEVRKHTFIGVPDARTATVLQEAQELANHILSIYRALMLFERVFAEAGSYDKFVIFNHRSPSLRDLQALAHQQKVRIPFLALPFKADLTLPTLAAVIEDTVDAGFETKPRGKLLLKKPQSIVKQDSVRVAAHATASQLQALAGKFGRHSSTKHAFTSTFVGTPTSVHHAH